MAGSGSHPNFSSGSDNFLNNSEYLSGSEAWAAWPAKLKVYKVYNVANVHIYIWITSKPHQMTEFVSCKYINFLTP
jgi:hypothetical protein